MDRRMLERPWRWLARLRPLLASLKLRIVALAVVSATLASLVAVQLSLAVAEDDSLQALLASEAENGRLLAGQLGDKLQLQRSVLQAVAEASRDAPWHDAAAMLGFLHSKPGALVLYPTLTAATPDGRVLARVQPGPARAPALSLADRDYFAQALRSRGAVVSAPLHGRLSGRPVVVIAVAVRDAQDRPLGVLLGELALQEHGLFAGLSAQAGAATALVVDRRGVVLAHPRPARLLGRAADEPGLRRLVPAWLAAGSPVGAAAHAQLSDGHLVTLAGIPGADWALLHVLPQAAATAPIVAARQRPWRQTLPVVALVALLAGAVAWAATAPIRRLQGHARRLLARPDSAGPWPQVPGELGELAALCAQVVDEGRQRQAEVQRLLHRLEAVLEHADVGIALTRGGRFELVSRQFCRLLECERAEAEGRATRDIYPSLAAYQALSALAGPAFVRDGGFDTEVELVTLRGRHFWGRLRGRAVSRQRSDEGTIWIVEDVSEARRQRELLSWAASHDPLTGLCNRAAFERRLAEALPQRATVPLCALFIDLDHFKQVNDSAGHAAGDAMLKGIAARLRQAVRQSDVVGRLGGDEFVVLLHNCSPPQARTVATKLCRAVGSYQLAWDGRRHSVGASVGLVSVGPAMDNVAAVLRAADAACYDAKRRGRDTVSEFDALPA